MIKITRMFHSLILINNTVMLSNPIFSKCIWLWILQIKSDTDFIFACVQIREVQKVRITATKGNHFFIP